MITVVGTYISPYVRKVLACLTLKELPYRIDPLVPFYGDDAFSRISPVRRIPVLIDADVTVADSAVICEYLDDAYPHPRLYPAAPADRARARWLEEYAGSRMGEVFIWRFFNELVIKRFVWGEPTDQAVLGRTVKEEIPLVLGYLESQLPESGYLFGDPGVADIAIASFFRNVALARSEVDFSKAPRTARFVERVLELPCLAGLREFESLCMRVPIAQQRDALREAGAPIAGETFQQPDPRRGVLSI